MKPLIVFLALIPGCAASGLSVGLYDEEAVFQRHPGLRGHVVTAAVYTPSRPPDSGEDLDIVGMVNFNGRLEMKLAPNLERAIRNANGFSHLACLPQILVVRPSDKSVIVCDWYLFVHKEDASQNVALRPRDVVVVTENYPESAPCAAEWGPVERFISGGSDRESLVKALTRRAPPK